MVFELVGNSVELAGNSVELVGNSFAAVGLLTLQRYEKPDFILGQPRARRGWFQPCFALSVGIPGVSVAAILRSDFVLREHNRLGVVGQREDVLGQLHAVVAGVERAGAAA